MHGLLIRLGQTIGAIDRGMRRNIQENEFAGTRQENFRNRTGTISGRWPGYKLADQIFELSQSAQRFTSNRTGKCGIARLKSMGRFERQIKRAAAP
jgi:hypothetical protein